MRSSKPCTFEFGVPLLEEGRKRFSFNSGHTKSGSSNGVSIGGSDYKVDYIHNNNNFKIYLPKNYSKARNIVATEILTTTFWKQVFNFS